jgi:Protein of unknown function (DUF2914)
MFSNFKSQLIDYYEKNETKVDVAFFLGGFIFDVLTLSEVDDPLSIAQQFIYLTFAGYILYQEFLNKFNLSSLSKKFPRFWKLRDLIFHFILGSLISVYSLFFFKSASLFNSFIFVLFIIGIMVANEIKFVQQKGLQVKTALFVLCLFSFISMLIPTMIGFVGAIPFGLSLILTAFLLYFPLKYCRKISVESDKDILFPATTVISAFVIFYFLGWVPPVPLSLKKVGIYHNVEKENGQFILSHENPWYRFWSNGDQNFKARPGDKIFVYTQIFAPKKFKDEIFLHWMYQTKNQGWKTSDKVKLNISGGRAEGFRGFAYKSNYQTGEWRVLVETTDEREIGRIYFDVEEDLSTAPRVFEKISFN